MVVTGSARRRLAALCEHPMLVSSGTHDIHNPDACDFGSPRERRVRVRAEAPSAVGSNGYTCWAPCRRCTVRTRSRSFCVLARPITGGCMR